MKCSDFEARLHPYIDGELSPDGMRAADSHVTECSGCAALAREEREFRRFVRSALHAPSPPGLSARVLKARRRELHRRAWRGRLLALGLGGAAAVLGTMAALLLLRPPAPLVADLVDAHLAYARIAVPAEFGSSDRGEIEAWFQGRAGLRVVVPDLSPAGISLLGARLLAVRQREAAYLLYEEGRTLLSVFIIPESRSVDTGGTPATYHGRRYAMTELKGLRAVSWSDGAAMFALVSRLDNDTLLDCAERLRLERERQGVL